MCPNCTNTDKKMMEILKDGRILCYICSKVFSRTEKV